MDHINEKRLDLGDSILGFSKYRYYRMEELEEQMPFVLLQSETDADIGFIVVSPFEIYPDYEFKLNDEVIAGLDIEKTEDVAVFSIVTINQPFDRSTINLLAPIVINVKSGLGRQVILNNVTYSIHAPLFPNKEGGL